MSSFTSETDRYTMYALEKELVADFLQCLNGMDTPWGRVQTVLEFDYRTGRTDIVAVTEDGTVIAFEAKLARWREAMHQAYKNTCFAHKSYVLVPEETARRASRYTQEFESRRVGLCSFSSDGVRVVRDPERHDPLHPWLTTQASQVAKETGRAAHS